MNTAQSITPSLIADTPLATIALRSDASAAILARHRLDFCCGGKRTLSQACSAAGLDLRGVLADLEAEAHARAAGDATTPDWNDRTLVEVIDFIVGTHHAFTRAAIARITPLLAKVTSKHGERHTELITIGRAYAELASEMEPHMLREERVLFPYLRAHAASGTAPTPAFGTVRNPVQRLMAEHDQAAVLLEQIVAASGGFSPPADACTSFRAVYAALAELRLDLLKHVSLENNVLFPRALAIEEGRIAA
jgi:regulator of cell morphogenesis and NO signaling